MSAQTAAAAPAAKKKSRPGGTLYRGNEGMWSWVLHRITGVAIFFFLLVHVLDTALIRVSPEAYNAVMSAYKTEIMGLGECALVAAILGLTGRAPSRICGIAGRGLGRTRARRLESS